MQPLLFHDLPLCLPYLPVQPEAVVLADIVRADAEDTLEETLAALEADGWDYIGTDSCFCKVMISPDGDRVLKLGSGSGSLATAQAAMALPNNPHLPKVYGFEFLTGDFEWAAEMELLSPLDDYDSDWDDGEDDIENCPSFRVWKSSVSWKGGSTYGGPDLTAMPDGPLKEAFAALSDRADGSTWDVHDGNIMVRPGTGEIVLNDLLA